MLKQLWQWLKRLFRRFFRTTKLSDTETAPVKLLKQLTDVEYENLFLELLEGVNKGWSRGIIKGFLAGRNVVEAGLVQWLEGFGERLLASDVPNDELAARMVRLGDLGVGKVGEVAKDIGMRLKRKNPTDIEYTEKETAEVETWFNRGNQQSEVGNFKEAIASFDQALKFQPDNHKAWYKRGNALDKLEQFEEAIASYDQALKFQPDCHEAWSNRGFALGNLERFEEAIASYDQALKFQPDVHEAWCNRGNALLNLERFEEAIASHDQALKFQPDCHVAWFNRGITLDKLERFEQAIASYDQTLKFQPDFHQAWFNRGVALGNLERFEEAIASYDQSLKFQPDFHGAWFNRGFALGNLEQFEEAIASFDQALKFQPDFHEAWYRRGNALHNLERFEEAIASYDQALKFQPDDHKAWFYRGFALGNLERFEEAIASYDQALKFQPDDHKAWFYRGFALGNLERFEEAIASYDQALKFQPDDHKAWFYRGFALGNLERFEEAIASYDLALKFQPDFHEAWGNRGIALGNLERFEEAIASYDLALKFQPDFHDAWSNRGIALSNLERFEEAIASYDQSLKFQPDDHKAWFYRGNALGNLERFEEAIASFDLALKFQPDFHQAWCNRGIALSNLERFEEAIASFDLALKFQPDFHDAWSNRGIALSNLERFEEAIASFDQALKFQPDFHEDWYNRGVVLDKLEWFEEAIASYDQALKFQPDDHEAWSNRGVVLDKLERFEEAIASYDQALKFQPDDHEAWCNRGNALGNLERFEEAIVSYDQALKFQPDDHEAWCNRGFAAGASISFNQLFAFSSTIAIKNPDLNQRGYEGELATYNEGLKYCPKETHPEGCGLLHQAIGNAHYYQGRGDYRPRSYWVKAANSYNRALETLTEKDFSELHLGVLQYLIRVRFNLGDTAKTEELQRRGTDILRNLLQNTKSPAKQKQLALKFAAFQGLTVDIAVQSGNWCAALEIAEKGKNACLSWLLYDYDNHESPTWADIQHLLNPTTVIVYWHLSPAALHTFILKHNVASPILLRETQLIEPELPSQVQRLIEFEAWVKNWNEQYPNSSYNKNEAAKKDRNGKAFKDNLPQMLDSLKNILNIPAIIEQISDVIQNIILIPHQDLHRFPLHALFPNKFTISYLPSAKIGLSVVGKATVIPENKYQELSLLSVEHPTSNGFATLEFAQVESEAICQIFSNPKSNPKRYSSEKATREALQSMLPENYNIFHFTGHGTYDFNNPALSYLALAGEDKLTLADIHGYSLPSYRLVTLAACETSITGNKTITTEYVGLVSGFMSCGVAHVVSTLWTVESEASALLMVHFYQMLQQGKPEKTALADASQWLQNVTNEELTKWYEAMIVKIPTNQISLLRFLSRRIDKLKQATQNYQPYKHPYFWAAFTITGT